LPGDAPVSISDLKDNETSTSLPSQERETLPVFGRPMPLHVPISAPRETRPSGHRTTSPMNEADPLGRGRCRFSRPAPMERAIREHHGYAIRRLSAIIEMRRTYMAQVVSVSSQPQGGRRHDRTSLDRAGTPRPSLHPLATTCSPQNHNHTQASRAEPASSASLHFNPPP
jgi:hypothetical protein